MSGSLDSTPSRAEAWQDPERLTAQQAEVGKLRPQLWHPRRSLSVAGCFVAFQRGEQGPGRRGDHAFVGASLVGEGGGPRRGVVIEARADGPYVPGLLAMREGPMMLDALQGLIRVAGRPDLVMVDATGRDHPRRCGLAVHLGWALGLPSVGVTHRLLTDRHQDPPVLEKRGDAAPIELHGEPVAAWVCTCDGVRPVVAHAGWRTDPATAVDIALRLAAGSRTPEPLREARRLAREARSAS